MDELRAASRKRLRDPVTFLKAAVPWLSIYNGSTEARAFYAALMNCTTVQQMKAICEDHTVMSTRDLTDTNATIMAIRNAFHVAIMMYPDNESVEAADESASKRQRTCSPPDAAEDRVSPIPVLAASAAAEADAPAGSPTPDSVRRSYRYSSTTPPPPPAKSRAKSPSYSY